MAKSKALVRAEVKLKKLQKEVKATEKRIKVLKTKEGKATPAKKAVKTKKKPAKKKKVTVKKRAVKRKVKMIQENISNPSSEI